MRTDSARIAPPSKKYTADWQILVLSCALPLVLCAAKLDLDLWYDEAYTLQAYVSRPAWQIVTDYSAPNNHILYSLLLRPWYLISDSDFVLRFPSLMISAATLAMMFRLGRRCGGPAAGGVSVLVLGLTQMFLVHTMQLRGYGLSIFLAVWLADLAVSRTGERTARRSLTIVLAGAGFLYTMPTNALFLAPQTVLAAAIAWARVDRRAAIRELATWVAAWVLAFLADLPVLDQVWSSVGNSSRGDLRATGTIVRQVVAAAMHDSWPLALLVPPGIVAWMARRRREPLGETAYLPVLLPAMILGPFLLTALLGVTPFVRNYCPWVPFLAIGIGWPLVECARWGLHFATRKPIEGEQSEMPVFLIGAAVVLATLVPAAWRYPARLAEVRDQRFAQDGYYNYYAADFSPSTVVAYLQEATARDANYTVAFDRSAYFTLPHYALRAEFRMPRAHPGATIYYVAPAIAHLEDVSAMCDVPIETLRTFPRIRRIGYFHIYRSREPLRVE